MAENFLTRDVGPFPGYVWVLGGAAALLLYRSYQSNKAQSAQAAGSTAGGQLTAAQAQAAQQAQQQQLLASEMASAYYPTYQGQQTPIYLINLSGASTPTGQTTGAASGAPSATTPAQGAPVATIQPITALSG
jgi:hypothetical protein